MKIPVLAFYETLAEKTSKFWKCFKIKKNYKLCYFCKKNQKIVNLKIKKKWKTIAYCDSAYSK